MNTAILLLDYVNDIVAPGGKIAAAAEQVAQRGVIATANRVSALARARGWPLAFVKVGFAPGYPECPSHSPMFGGAPKAGALQLGGWGTEFHEALDVQGSDFVLVKPRVSAFYATPLEAWLRAHEIQRLLIAGVSTAYAVQAAARDAHDRDYRVAVIEDACAAATADDHESSIRQLARLATIVRSDAID